MAYRSHLLASLASRGSSGFRELSGTPPLGNIAPPDADRAFDQLARSLAGEMPRRSGRKTMRLHNRLAAALVAAFVTMATAAYAADSNPRYRVNPVPSRMMEVTVTRAESTWFTGTDASGRRVTVVFQKRFASVKRDGELVPVSYLRPGDRVTVVGQRHGSQLQASSAAVERPRTAGARLLSNPAPARTAPCCAVPTAGCCADASAGDTDSAPAKSCCG
jgi:hypothetical protein